uniref:ATP-dependent DNA ligase n=1 Tax=Candidatus Methanomethylicus mesodigestus TaxID=1867258 RepID=A0A7C3IXM6_9CREN
MGNGGEGGDASKNGSQRAGEGSYVIHDHRSKRPHHDLRLERGGVLKSWALPKGMPSSPGERRLAIMVEDHPLEYGSFEGTIAEGEYGAGEVRIWDRGTYEEVSWSDEKIEFVLKGGKASGKYALVRFRKAGEGAWLLLRGRG